MRSVLGLTLLSACAPPPLAETTTFTYVLQGYPGGRLDAVERAPHPLAIIDLSRDGTTAGYFTAGEIARVRARGKRVLAYFEIGSIETFRTEYRALRGGGLVLNRWPDWPDERFVRYWEPAWWDRVVRPRIDQALRAGFDGVYLDTPLAYEEIDLARVPGETRAGLARKMAGLIVRVSEHARRARPGFLIVPQNSPELRHQPGYVQAIDGIGMEELFYRATDEPCDESWCRENLKDALALRELGKIVLATDYARRPANVAAACARHRRYGLAGNVTVVDLDRVSPPCE
ncbi:cysteinyl-tRNA synthetase, unknown class [Nonomuraea solani]|uniref:Glycoside-hydrolase family GH114 TIM-barrel domain-containing protein n=1 Tax=Nonomuraea solani TaxID=1144553 RepID=A0A1H6CKE6_9ACTN|nr:endo alpha-1,4 polygalactosaminidase [Nonomuraea solani]SEG73420.1 cysteinyl-tRNA synthetase, unknown class [Nonomuraea solani]